MPDYNDPDALPPIDWDAVAKKKRSKAWRAWAIGMLGEVGKTTYTPTTSDAVLFKALGRLIGNGIADAGPDPSIEKELETLADKTEFTVKAGEIAINLKVNANNHWEIESTTLVREDWPDNCKDTIESLLLALARFGVIHQFNVGTTGRALETTLDAITNHLGDD